MYKYRVFYNEEVKAKAVYNDLKSKGYEVTINYEGVKYGQSVITVEWWV